ncbi:MAG: hypothetical protein KDK62_04705 [Chlamydiia bacterium]|nr:hypothetical protein [Chlamydiia bacterium]
MMNLTFCPGRPVNPTPLIPIPPGGSAAAKTEASPTPVSGEKRAYSLLGTEEVLSESDSENDSYTKSQSEKPNCSTSFLREERRYFPPAENQRFTHVDCRYFKKVSGERGLVAHADDVEARNSPEMVRNKIDRIVAECLYGRKACDPNFSPARSAKTSSCYSNRLQTFQPLMDRFKRHLNKDDFEAVQSIIEKAKTKNLNAYDRAVINCLYAELPIISGHEFSWDD